jgi:hypothetical protein
LPAPAPWGGARGDLMASQEDYYDFSEAHIDQIIEATRLKGVDLDRRALLNDLIECYERYKKIVSAGSFRRHRERLISIRKHIDRAVKLIGEDNNDLGVIRDLIYSHLRPHALSRDLFRSAF